MKNLVISLIYSLIMTLISLSAIYLLQAPLISFVYYGFFSGSNTVFFYNNILGKIPNTDTITIVIMIIQIVLTIGFILVMFRFISKVINIFLKNEKLVKPYYIIFFFMTSVIPIFIIFLSIFLKVRLTILTLVIEGVFTVLNIVLITFSRKILPDTTDFEYRKYLFKEGSEDD